MFEDSKTGVMPTRKQECFVSSQRLSPDQGFYKSPKRASFPYTSSQNQTRTSPYSTQSWGLKETTRFIEPEQETLRPLRGQLKEEKRVGCRKGQLKEGASVGGRRGQLKEGASVGGRNIKCEMRDPEEEQEQNMIELIVSTFLYKFLNAFLNTFLYTYLYIHASGE